MTGVIIHEGYGLSETSPVVSLQPADGSPSSPARPDLPMPSTDVTLLDDDGRVGHGAAGEICVKGRR